MKFQGQIRKMKAQWAEPIQYYLNLSRDLLHINELLQRHITISHQGYECVNCGSDEPIYQMGFCKKCFFESPYASETILKPELSKAHLGIEERDLSVEKEIQLQPHIVYLAYTGDFKVGVTRETQIPTRWIDQGASQALPIARTENRYEAGMIEVALKQHLSDKTNWRKMLQLQSIDNDTDLYAKRDEITPLIPAEYQKFIIDAEVLNLDFPYQPPASIRSVSLSKTPNFEGQLVGIKGQYWCFQDGSVMNIRAHEGFVVALQIS